jgi:hypothetical protein
MVKKKMKMVTLPCRGDGINIRDSLAPPMLEVLWQGIE